MLLSNDAAAIANRTGTIENAEIARLFNHAADLIELKSADTFRVRAYRAAARNIEQMPERVARIAIDHPEALTDIPGVGDHLAGRIVELATKGTAGFLEELERGTPSGAVDLLSIPGIGPKRARVLSAIGINSRAKLLRAAMKGKLRGIRGLGPALELRLRKELSRPEAPQRHLRATAAQYADSISEYLREQPGIEKVEVAGSFRRKCETVGDLDVLVTTRKPAAVSSHFVNYPGASKVLAHGITRSTIVLKNGLQVDLRVLQPERYGAGLLYFTGSKPHNIALRRIAQKKALKLSEYGLFRGKRNIASATEEDIYATLGLPWMAPEVREDKGEIEAARAGKLPRLVQLSDVRGDLQCHTTDSDGRDTLEDMAEAATRLGYEYLAVTDHAAGIGVVGGLEADGFRKQRRRIEKLNARLDKLTILCGAEVDIRKDGSLGLDSGTLESLDIVVVSVHSHFELSSQEQTDRVVRAIRSGHAHVFGHPTARLIGSRRPIALDLAEVIRVAADTGVMLEVNGQPERLDLDDAGARAAVEGGVLLTLGSDAHSAADMRFMQYAVDQARRGWVSRKNVANALTLNALLKRLRSA